ncbi:hypothetical protein [Ligilactobacillus apodemi]|uniref:DUF1659 domain-containing protein n=1 Tax=Ligilactobacillus apodemi DSM 16634 = JCM 16172 TaxID=1423724 RepID=A0A0R1U1R5_9LACO|nr:hypothetical protein [Ligilactobacillus apodemi]KRL87328.1 hypothetical protein FC32_GL001752 [Ligilactobacillus apodemi DSM 16634 = JCM 16172]MCR1901742.1 hypothetical protein [Ligilactobacillus apodemi]
MTEVKWDKNAVRVVLEKAEGGMRQRSFNNVSQNVSPEQLQRFGQLIALLTGEKLRTVVETTTTQLN